MNKISVIIPVYKVEPYLERCVQSVLNQTYTNIEVILVDDGSPDNCPIMCDEWAKKDHRIRVIHKVNGGLSSARNVGMGQASGEYIAFVDSDDWIAEEMLERLLGAIHKDNSDIAACAVEMVWENSTRKENLTVQINKVLYRQEAQQALLEESLLKNPVWYKLYKREIVRNIMFEVGRYHEDVFWSYQVIGNANSVSLIDYIGYYYFQHTQSIMGEKYSLKRLDAMEAYEQRYQYIKENFPELEVKARINVFSSCIYNGQMVIKNLHGNERREALKYLDEIKNKYPIGRKEYSDFKTTHRVWMDLARISLKTACYLKNFLGVGM